MKKMPVDELLRLACIHAEQDLYGLVNAWGADSPEGKEYHELWKHIHNYRMKRWGTTALEFTIDNSKSLTLKEIMEDEHDPGTS
jgi:beta-mannanase